MDHNITIRVTRVMQMKLDYIAKYEFRTRTHELHKLINDRIREFEDEHGAIPIQEEQSQT